jgi:hypothetical protein
VAALNFNVTEADCTGVVIRYGSANTATTGNSEALGMVVDDLGAVMEDIELRLLRNESRREQIEKRGEGYKAPVMRRSLFRARPEFHARSHPISSWRGRRILLEKGSER